jgi:hypothetical protein
MLVSYFPKKGSERTFLSLLKKHWPALNQAGLVSPMPPQVWRAADKRTGRAFFVEMFQWKDQRASDVAHRTPGVQAIWGPMGPLLEDMQLARIVPLAISSKKKQVRQR